MPAAAAEFSERGYVASSAASIAKRGLSPSLASADDAFAVVGGITELISRHVRRGVPKHVLELEPVIDRLIDAVLARGST